MQTLENSLSLPASNVQSYVNSGSGKSADRNKSGACRLHSNAYSFTREDNSCFNRVSGKELFPLD